MHALPAAAFLKRALPEAHISWVVERRASAILKDSPVIDRLIEIDTRSWRRHMLDRRTTLDARARIEDIRQSGAQSNGGKVDIAIDLQGLIKSGIVARASGAKKRIGFDSPDLREKASRVFLTDQVNTSDLRHVIEKNLALARAALEMNNAAALEMSDATDDSSRYEFPLAVSPEDERFAESETQAHGYGFAILNPGGGWTTKLWPAELFGQLADLLLEQHGVSSIVTYGPGEEALAAQVAASSRAKAARPLASTLKQFIALARRARLFVGGDTGPLHLAAASSTPIVGIYGPTSAERNGPFDKLDVVVGQDLWCRSNCHRRSCWHWECMDIPLSTVAKAVSIRLANQAKPNEAQVRLK